MIHQDPWGPATGQQKKSFDDVITYKEVSPDIVWQWFLTVFIV